MVLLNAINLLPTFLLGLDPSTILGGIDFVEIIFGVLSEVTFLVDIFIGAALVMAVVRGIFKNFWKVLWRGIIFSVLIGVLFILAGTLIAQIGALPISLKGEVDGTAVEWANLREVIEGVISSAGNGSAYTTAMTDVILKNLVIFLGVPLIAIVTPMVSGITFPLISLAIPKKWKKLKLLPVKLAVSIAFTLIGVMAFIIPMATLVPPMSAIKPLVADDTLMKKFLNPSLIGFFELFTAEKSIFIKVVNLGGVAGSLNVLGSFDVGGTTLKLSEQLTALFTALNSIQYTAAA